MKGSSNFSEMYNLNMDANDPLLDRVPKRDLIIFSKMYSLYMGPNEQDKIPERDLNIFVKWTIYTGP